MQIFKVFVFRHAWTEEEEWVRPDTSDLVNFIIITVRVSIVIMIITIRVSIVIIIITIKDVIITTKLILISSGVGSTRAP